MYRQLEKRVKQQYLLHITYSHNMVNFGPLTPEIGWRVWGTQQISTGFACWLRYCTDDAQQRPTKLCTMFGRLLGWYTTYIFGGSCSLTEFYQVQNSLCVQVMRSPIVPALLRSTRAVTGRPSRWASAHILVIF